MSADKRKSMRPPSVNKSAKGLKTASLKTKSSPDIKEQPADGQQSKGEG